MENKFQTISSSSKNIKTVLIACGVMAVMALFGLIISFAAFIFFEAIIAISTLMMLFLVSRTKWVLYFSGATLTITNTANQNQYYFNDLKHSDFIFNQNQLQKKKNCGHLKIVGSSAVFSDVKNFEEMKAYIDQNFS